MGHVYEASDHHHPRTAGGLEESDVPPMSKGRKETKEARTR